MKGKKEIAKHCGICVDTLTSWAKTYDMPIVVINRGWFALKYQLGEWLALPYERRKKKSGEPPSRTDFL